MKEIEPNTLHDQSGIFSKYISVGLLIYFIYRYIKCLFLTKSLTSAFISACLGDDAPFIFVPLLIAIIVYFIDWAMYTLIKKKVLKSGRTYNGTITREIKQGRISRGGGYSTYRYIVSLEDGTTVKSPVYTHPIFRKNCVVHKYLGVVVLTDFKIDLH